MNNTANVMNNKKKGFVQLGLLFLFFVSLVVSFTFSPEEGNTSAAATIIALIPLMPYPFLLVGNLIFHKKFQKKFKNITVAEGNALIVSKLENIEKTYESDRAKMYRLLLIAELEKWYFAITALVMGSLTIVRGIYIAAVVWILFGIIFFGSTIMRIKVYDYKSQRPLYKEILDRDEFSSVYSLAAKAAEQNGCKGKISIIPVNDFGVSIMIFPGDLYIYLGAAALAIFNEQELYNVFLHEFSHSDLEKNEIDIKINQHLQMILEARSDRAATFFHIPYLIIDEIFIYKYSIFKVSSSVYKETEADKAMLKGGNPHAAASALIKLAYTILYDWENGNEDLEPIFSAEEMIKDYQTRRIGEFTKKMGERAEDWNKLLQNEIQARNASHPIVRTRLKTLGVDRFETENCDGDSEEYKSEKTKIIAQMDESNFNNIKENYKDIREQNYVQPLEIVTKWEEAGKPLDAAGYRDIVNSLLVIGRHHDAFALCQRAVDELPATAAAFGIFICGMRKLHGYDPAGVEQVRKAMKLNENYVDEGIELIGSFACITGNQELLDSHRKEAVVLAQKVKDIINEVTILKPHDKLEAEHMPEGQLEADIEAMLKVGEDLIDRIYLVRKTVQTEFRSHYIVKLKKSAKPEEFDRIFRAIFNYLDTVSDWPYCLDYYMALYKKVRFRSIKGALVYKAEKKK